MSQITAQYLKYSKLETPLPAPQQARLEAWLARYFEALGDGAPNEEWRHVLGADAASGRQYFGLVQDRLSELADEFTERWSALRESRLEWLVADTLCYAELEAAREQLRLSHSYLKGRSRLGWVARKALVELLVALAWLALIAFLWQQPLAVLLIVAVTILWKIHRWQVDKERADLATAMVGTYGTMASAPVCWSLVWESMGESRRKGAVWPAAMYRLVDKLRQMPPV